MGRSGRANAIWGCARRAAYDRFEPDTTCADCHVDIARQYEQALMSECFTHPWDETEYFELALPHNEQDPFGQWVKATHLEWRDSPWAKGGIVCQDCHMPKAAGNPAPDAGGEDHADVRQHLFHGAHDPGKLHGSVEVRIHPSERQANPGDTVTMTATVVNAKAGHMIPSGSAEERVVWLHVEATDAAGHQIALPVTPKGFEGETMTIADPAANAYFVIGEIRGIEGFEGLARRCAVRAQVDAQSGRLHQLEQLPVLPRSRQRCRDPHRAG